jgi:arylformamidase
MAFDNLTPQPPINIRADAYAETALRLSRLAAMTTRCKLDVAYGDDPQQKLDIYLPKDECLKGLPVFVNIHGGGWAHGYKEWLGLNAPAIVEFPAIYVSLGYRLAPQFQHPSQYDDCLAALAWVYRNIAQFGGNPGRITIGGHSAGAQLSALVALRKDALKKHRLPATVIKACFAYNGIYDFRGLEAYGERGPGYGMGTPLIPSIAAAEDASPIRFVVGNTTPFYVTWAENDGLFIKSESSAFVAALRTQSARVEAHMFERFDHFWSHISQRDPSNLWTRTLKAWMTGDPHSVPMPI